MKQYIQRDPISNSYFLHLSATALCGTLLRFQNLRNSFKQQIILSTYVCIMSIQPQSFVLGNQSMSRKSSLAFNVLQPAKSFQVGFGYDENLKMSMSRIQAIQTCRRRGPFVVVTQHLFHIICRVCCNGSIFLPLLFKYHSVDVGGLSSQ